MNSNEVIKELKNYCYNNVKTMDQEKEMMKNYQIEYLDGFIGLILNKYKDEGKSEVYINIKNTDDIASPLLYKEFINENEADSYYEELKKIIDNNNEKYIANYCKIRD